jgi:nucleoside-diphosphate-sugar epimerase
MKNIVKRVAAPTPKFFKEDPVGTILPNILGTKNLLDLAIIKKVKQFLF